MNLKQRLEVLCKWPIQFKVTCNNGEYYARFVSGDRVLVSGSNANLLVLTECLIKAMEVNYVQRLAG